MAAASPATRIAARLASLAMLSVWLWPAAASSGSDSACVADIARANGDLRSFTARIRQTKRLALLAEPLASSGRVAFERPDRIAWEIDGATPMRVILDGERIWIPGMSGAEDAGTAFGPSRLVRRLGALFSGDLDAVGDTFHVTATCAAQRADVSLRPRTPELATAVSSLTLALAGPHLLVRRISMTNGVGDSLEIELTDVKRNVAIPSSLFSIGGDRR